MTADFLPPRQTGRADFPPPAFAGRSWATHSQVDESHPFELGVNGGALRGPPRPLAAAAKMPRQTFPHEAVDLPEGFPALKFGPFLAGARRHGRRYAALNRMDGRLGAGFSHFASWAGPCMKS